MSKFLCVATCWNDDILLHLEEQGIHKKIFELFGSLSTSIIGSGRPSYGLPKISVVEARDHIEKVHSMGIKFNYLLNAPCLGNREFTNEGRKKILSLLNWLDDCNVNMVTVSSPYLVEIIKRQHPQLAIDISAIAHVDSLQKAKFWETIGADRITIDFMMNRNFQFLENISHEVKCDLEVIVNDLCLYKCPIRYYHYNITAHASQEGNEENALEHKLAYSYPTLKCNLIRLTDVSEIIKSPWIRPEDIKFYRDLGINFFKVTGRTKPVDILMSYAKAYSERVYRGNLLDIVPIPTAGMKDARIFLKNSGIYVNNKKLEGFINYFQAGKCQTNCSGCNYCYGVAKEVIEIRDERQLDKLIDLLNKRLDSAVNINTI